MGLIKRVLFRHGRARMNQKSNLITSNALMEAIAKVNGDHQEGTNVLSHQTQEDGVVRMKILVRRQDLKQVLELMNGGINSQASVVRPSSLCVEQRLSLLRKKHLLRASLAAKHSRQSSWRPALQSIPEEI
ncbi:hypothetical protein Pyn_10648 [Prunus yedoensis var. nudiflora]|uniref:Uncharacterized protein n=1 Tax=Prunus yedoensis var. nudiflora TaxID=2094558 RepID=A0A314YA00_PRUYE|nr:hypothetical protein Pyn_10648 [Prunus yedoensis var. nudiflora]